MRTKQSAKSLGYDAESMWPFSDYLFKFIVIGLSLRPVLFVIHHAEIESRRSWYWQILPPTSLHPRVLCVTAYILEACGIRADDDASVKENSAHTIGVEFSSRTLIIGDRNIKLQVGAPSSRKSSSGGCRLDSTRKELMSFVSFGIQLDKRGSDLLHGHTTVRRACFGIGKGLIQACRRSSWCIAGLRYNLVRNLHIGAASLLMTVHL